MNWVYNPKYYIYLNINIFNLTLHLNFKIFKFKITIYWKHKNIIFGISLFRSQNLKKKNQFWKKHTSDTYTLNLVDLEHKIDSIFHIKQTLI